MQIDIDIFLSPEVLGDADKLNPAVGIIKVVNIREAASLPFESQSDRYELLVELNGIEYNWFANKTSLRALTVKHGRASENWVGKKIRLWTVEQNVQGKMRKVIYCEPDAK